MDTPSDSDGGRRRRRRTAAHIFFDEYPVYSDSEEESEFLRLMSPRREDADNMSARENIDLQNISNPLLKSILAVSCRNCICCQRILDLFDHSEASSAPNQSVSPSECNEPNGFRVEYFSTHATQQLKQSVDKQSSSKKPEALVPSKTNCSNQIGGSNTALGCKLKPKRQKKNLCCLKRAKRRKVTNTTAETNSSLSQTESDDDRTRQTQENIGDNDNTMDTKKRRPARKLWKGKRKSMSNMINQNNWESTSSVSRSRSLTSLAHYELRKSPGKLKFAKENDSVRLTPLKKSRTVYSKIDNRVFKISIDTTADRGFVRAVARKLARRGGISFDLFSVQNASFRLQTKEKSRMLYSPTAWLNSPLFERICKHN